MIPDYIVWNADWFITVANDSSSIDSTCFFPMYMIGGYGESNNGMAQNKYFFYTLPHYALSIRFHFYEIGICSATLSITVDTVSAFQSTITNAGSNAYLINKTCNGMPLFHKKVYVYRLHSSNPITITTNLKTSTASNFWWGANNWVVKLEGCDPTCMNCTGMLSSQCTDCYPHATLNSGVCTCDSGYYLYPTPLVYPCIAYPCSNCVALIPNCVSYANLLCTQCNTTYYVTNSGTTCSSCSTTCKTCNGTITNCTSCQTSTYLQSNTCLTLCSAGTYAYDPNNTCITKCPSGFWTSTIDGKCKACDTSCQTCSQSALNCSSCNNGTYLYAGSCSAQCPNSYWGSSVDNTCYACNSNCLTCSMSSTNCTSCPNNTFLNGNTCNASCPNGKYASTTDNTCKNCSITCNTCSNTSTNCTSCTGNYYLYSNNCSSTCPNGYWGSSVDNTCYACNSNCLTCSKSSTNCTSCPNNTFLNGNTCSASCPNGEYASTTDNTCKNCNITCHTCSNISTNCTSCTGNLYLYSNNCSNTCPNGYWVSLTDNLCMPCSYPCLNCSSSATNCTACNLTTYLYNNNCSTQCPSEYGPSDINNTCDICDVSCAKCANGSLNSNCITCASGYFMNSSGFCLPCSSNCSTCEGIEGNCTSCTANYDLVNNTCLASCQSGFYRNYLGDCLKCDVGCKECSGNASNCISCSVGYTLRALNSSFYCIKNCLSIEYFDYITQICQNIINISANLSRNFSDSSTFSLLFSNATSSFLQKINKTSPSYTLSISNLTSSDYSYTIINITEGFALIFKFNKIVDNTNTLLIVFNQSYLNTVDTILTTKNVSISLGSPYIYITPSLKTTSDPTILLLSFSSVFPELFAMLYNVSTVLISEFSSKNFNFTFKNTSNSSVFQLLLNYSVSLIGDHTLDLTFTLSDPIFSLTYRKLTTNSLLLALNNYYILSQNDQTAIQITNQATSTSNKAASSAISAFSLMSGGSSLAYSALLLMKFIKFLKFLNINYPPNALAVFEAELNFFDVLPNFDIAHNDNPCDVKFDYYNIDNYVLNNRGQLVIQNIGIFMIGMLYNHLLTWLISKRKLREGILKNILVQIHEILVWNFAITFSIAAINDFFFYGVINLVFATPTDFLGIFNIASSCCLIFSNGLLLYLMYKKISEINDILLTSKIDELSLGKRHEDFLSNRAISMAASPKKINPLKNSEDSDFDFGSFAKKQDVKIVKGHIVLNESMEKNTSIERKLPNFRPLRIKKTQVITSFKDNEVEQIVSARSNGLDSKKGINSPILNETNDMSPLNFKKTMKTAISERNIEKPHVVSSMEASIEKRVDYDHVLKKYKILYNDFKQERKIMSIYFVLDLVKFPVISLIIILDRYHPMRQSIFILSIMMGMLLFLIILRPLKSKYLFMQYFLNQVCIVFCTIAAMILAYYDQEKDYDQAKRLRVGWIIVYGNLGLIYLIAFLMIVSCLVIMYRVMKLACRKMKKNTKVLPFEET